MLLLLLFYQHQGGLTMKKCDCYGDEQNCDLEMELPDDYIDTLYEIYAKETKNPLTKTEWLKTVVS